ncbi:MAG: hypothetical protein JJE36_01305 [Coriobacteriia bacterium]|nr:hypothetical protein [Coriobacteriia bacterium]
MKKLLIFFTLSVAMLALLTGCGNKKADIGIGGKQFTGGGATILFEGANIVAGNIDINTLTGRYVLGEADSKGVRPLSIKNVDFLDSAPDDNSEPIIEMLETQVAKYAIVGKKSYLEDSAGNVLLTEVPVSQQTGVTDGIDGLKQ